MPREPVKRGSAESAKNTKVLGGGPWSVAEPMAAEPPKADIAQHGCDVRFVPKADIASDAAGFGRDRVTPDFLLVLRRVFFNCQTHQYHSE